MLWVLTGTRPDIIKLAPVCWELDQLQIPYLWIHSGQHYDDKMATCFFDLVVQRRPDFVLRPPKEASPGDRLASIKDGLRELKSACSHIIVQGDTLSALAGALFAHEIEVPAIHVEAGLRSGDIRTPEELIRISIDHISDLLLAPTKHSMGHLEKEGLGSKSQFVGNTIVDVLNAIITKYGYVDLSGYQWATRFILLTLHRTENLANPHAIEELFRALRKLVWCGYQIVFPVHPHTQKVLEELAISYRTLLATVPPQDYRAFLSMLSKAQLVITDSGSVQEEAYLLGVPCVTIRATTERPETVEARANVLVDLARTPSSKIEKQVDARIKAPRDWSRDAYGSGGATTKIIEILKTKYGI